MRSSFAATAMAFALIIARPTHALTAQDFGSFAQGGPSERAVLLGQWAARGDTGLATFIASLENGEYRSTPEGKLVRTLDGETFTDAATDSVLGAPKPEWEDVVVSNVLRAGVEGAKAALQLSIPDEGERLQAAKDLLEAELDPAILPAIEKAAVKETSPAIKALLDGLVAKLALSADEPEKRIAAARALGESGDASNNLKLLDARINPGEDSSIAETDSVVRLEIAKIAAGLRTKVWFYEMTGHLFTGISLGSILVLVALGLAITYGLLGVINMAHGELVMIGAYTTYLVQGVFRSHFAASESVYILAAIPAAFLVSGLVGVALERLILRHLYGRPLESLLATWGVSLFLIQTVRSLFGPQNVEVASPAWLSGSLVLQSNLVLPWNRLAIIAFAGTVLVLTAIVLTKTRLGLFIRATTQNRAMSRCVGVKTSLVDMMAFGLGSGLAGLAGVALSQVGNVGPDLGQGYIVDSFLVVVVGGVGQLAGSLWAGLGIGMLTKFLEPTVGAVLAKIALLVLIILFIQKRPQGLFALKGRQAD
ncbi:MAG: urea transporter permease [Fibrobacterota bacterium]|jgi:urea transport system permease protein